MPGSMTHLLVAHMFRPAGTPLFFLGNIAPDAVHTREDKDITHFRTLPDREPALRKLAAQTGGDFAEGVLLHLYVDWRWDVTLLQTFIEHTGGDWFPFYHPELSMASNDEYRHAAWAQQLWADMDALDPALYGATPRATAEDVKEFVHRNRLWLGEHIIGPSPAFPPDTVEAFAQKTARDYAVWRKT